MSSTFVYREKDSGGRPYGVSFGWNDSLCTYFMDVYDWYDTMDFFLRIGTEYQQYDDFELFLVISIQMLQDKGLPHHEFERRARGIASITHH